MIMYHSCKTHITGAIGLLFSAIILCIRTPTPVEDLFLLRLVSSIVVRLNSPSKQPSRIPHIIPDPTAVFGPAKRQLLHLLATFDINNLKVNHIHIDSPRIAKLPPVKKPAMMEFQWSSFCLTPFTVQSKVENIVPQIPKFPPKTGALAFIDERDPGSRYPFFYITHISMSARYLQ